MTSPNRSYHPSKEIIQASSTNIGRLFESVVDQARTAVAIIENNRTMTYGELNDRVNKLANGLLDKGIKHGDRIALLTRNCAAYLEIELACAKAGIILVSLNWRLTQEEVKHCLDASSKAKTLESTS